MFSLFDNIYNLFKLLKSKIPSNNVYFKQNLIKILKR